ncbi:MAG: ATP-dependent DNA helicase RecG [Spirochaetaceae bacterium]|nr:ATP-dependent DNA helicase RecG [Spirochaetaceae bacterium]
MPSLKMLKGVGSVSIKYLKEAGITSVSDLLYYFPRAYEFRDVISSLSDVRKNNGEHVTITALCKVDDFSYFFHGSKKTLKIHISDDSDQATLVCFGRNFLANSIQPEEFYYIYGTFSMRFGEIQSSNFEYEKSNSSPVNFLKIIPVYPLTSDLTQGFLRKIIRSAIETEGRYAKDILPECIINKNNFLTQAKTISNIHFPESRQLLEDAVKILKYEEFFIFQKTIIELKKEKTTQKREKRVLPRTLQSKILNTLPFSLTPDQQTIIEEIYNDSISVSPMDRILQGDVGCGKTIVAFLSVVPYIESGYQVAFMAPTELLAKQHLETASKLFSDTNIKMAFLSGRIPEAKKKYVRDALEAGDIDLIIGTHSLLSDPVKFKNLGFVIVDEQHKFGVSQRTALAEKGKNVDYLMMTATPIPRTLQMTFFGDIAISTIRTMPKGRIPIITYSAFQENIQKVYDWVKKELEKGFQAYFIYPLIEESSVLNLKNAETMFKHLDEKIFPEYKCAMLHSRLNEDIKEEVMKDFSSGKINILVATSIVEVGVDVPKATCMVIDHAERFGLTALHQLRGRIGRREDQSYTFLVFSRELTDEAKSRLRVIKENSDGFKIAEEDLKLRGHGDITGIRQSGFAEFKIANIIEDKDILEKARKDAIEYFRV